MAENLFKKMITSYLELGDGNRYAYPGSTENSKDEPKETHTETLKL